MMYNFLTIRKGILWIDLCVKNTYGQVCVPPGITGWAAVLILGAAAIGQAVLDAVFSK